MKDCASLKELYTRGSHRTYLQRSICDNAHRYVCCPNECTTSDNSSGLCERLKSCPEFADLLAKKPISSEALTVIRSRHELCGFGDEDNQKYLVCCKTFKKLPEPPFCGMDTTDRIYGGTDTSIDEFPWTVLLFYNVTRRNVVQAQYLCGSSLINERYVLTGNDIERDE